MRFFPSNFSLTALQRYVKIRFLQTFLLLFLHKNSFSYNTLINSMLRVKNYTPCTAVKIHGMYRLRTWHVSGLYMPCMEQFAAIYF